MLGVANDSPERLNEFLKSNYLPWPNIADGNPGKVTSQWGVKRFPSAMLIDHNGLIIAQWFGGMDPDDVWEQTEKAIREAQR